MRLFANIASPTKSRVLYVISVRTKCLQEKTQIYIYYGYVKTLYCLIWQAKWAQVKKERFLSFPFPWMFIKNKAKRKSKVYKRR